jgi:HSP20 family protein
MRNTLSVWRPFEDSMTDLFGIARDFERGLSDYYEPGHALRVHVDMNDDNYIIKAEVPGIAQDDLNISFEDNTVKIEAEYKEDDGHVFRQGKYSKSFRLTDVDADKADANLKDGILTITLPKAEHKKPRKIKIK